MIARQPALAFALILAAQPLLADHAQSRGGGGGSSSSVGAQHHSGGGASSSSSGSSGGHSGYSGRSESAQPTDAQRRHPQPGTGTGGRFYGRGYYGGYYGYPRYYYGFGLGLGYYPYGYSYPYSDFYGYPYGYGYGWGYRPYYGGYGYARGDQGAIRLMVDPDKARVYVDGYYAGIVDDFDGLFQRLNLPAGRHEITLKLEGYKTHRFRVYVPIDQTLKIHYNMEKGSGEEASEEVVGAPFEERDRRAFEERERAEVDREGHEDRPLRHPGDESHGRLRLGIRPQDASVYVDGDFRGSGRQVQVLDLPPGTHRIEVVRPGFRTVEREVEITRDHDNYLQIDLERP